MNSLNRLPGSLVPLELAGEASEDSNNRGRERTGPKGSTEQKEGEMNQKGFTLTELLVAVLFGLFWLACVGGSLYIGYLIILALLKYIGL